MFFENSYQGNHIGWPKALVKLKTDPDFDIGCMGKLSWKEVSKVWNLRRGYGMSPYKFS